VSTTERMSQVAIPNGAWMHRPTPVAVEEITPACWRRFARGVARFRREALVTVNRLVKERSAPPSAGELQESAHRGESTNPRYTPLVTEELGPGD
jgi:hypothetical protein